MGSLTKAHEVPSECSACGIALLSSWRFRQLSPAAKATTAEHVGRGLCSKCYARLKRNGTTDYVGPRRNGATSPDQVPVHQCRDCGQTMVSGKFMSRFPELREKHARLGGQGLCHRDYQRAVEEGRLERVNRSADEVLDDWVWIRDDGCTDVRHAAERLGMTWKALDRALYRARKRGDQRGSLIPFAHDMRRSA